MKLKLIWIFPIIVLAGCVSGPMGDWEFPDMEEGIQNPDEWELVFSDEFEGESLDESLWKVVLASEDERYHEDNVFLRDGKLVLAVDQTDQGLRAARIDTRDTYSQLYGLFEVRARIDQVEDTIFAFWMSHYPGVNQVGNQGRDGSEMDIIETGYKDDAVIHTFHWDGYGRDHKSHSTGKLAVPFSIHEGWHVYGLEWSESEARFYVDGVVTAVYRGVGIPRVEEFLILSSERQRHWDGRIADADLPVQFEVDWIRTYRRKQ